MKLLPSKLYNLSEVLGIHMEGGEALTSVCRLKTTYRRIRYNLEQLDKVVEIKNKISRASKMDRLVKGPTAQ